MSDAQRLEELEIKLAHLELGLLDLNEVVVRQQRELQQLQLRSQQLAHQLESGTASADPSAPEVPPHY